MRTLDLHNSNEEQLQYIETIRGEHQDLTTKESTKTQKELDAIREDHHYFIEWIQKAIDTLSNRICNMEVQLLRVHGDA